MFMCAFDWTLPRDMIQRDHARLPVSLQNSPNLDRAPQMRAANLITAEDESVQALPKKGEKKYWQTRAALLFGINVGSKPLDMSGASQERQAAGAGQEQVCIHHRRV
jgi:hypothetical protein